MGREIHELSVGFQLKVRAVLERCKDRGVIMRPYCTVRHPEEQARLWRQSRSTEEIHQEITHLRNHNAPYLAHCIQIVGPQHGRHVTNAPPGFSWHQWGEAVDCFWLRNDRAEWSTDEGGIFNGYRVYAAAARTLGLTAGGHWSSLQDWPHVQYRSISVWDKFQSLGIIDEEMRKRFDG